MEHSYFRIRCAGSFFNKETRTWGVCDKLIETVDKSFICSRCGAQGRFSGLRISRLWWRNRSWNW
jgi:predicted amidophosphoribosyltransferase